MLDVRFKDFLNKVFKSDFCIQFKKKIMEVKMFKSYEMELAGRKLVIETGKLAGLANGSVLVKYGDTDVLVSVTAAKEPKEGIDFFPLSVDYEEKLYSVGKIPGGFTKREGKPTEKAILTSRAIDRPLRPLFPKDFRNEVTVVATVLSVEQDNSPEVAAMIGASCALSISDIPFLLFQKEDVLFLQDYWNC